MTFITFRVSNPWLILAATVVVAVAIDPSLALAQESGGGMPWDAPLKRIGDALTGPVAYWFTLFGIFVAGAVLVFGGEINQFVRSLAMVVLVGAVMTGAVTVMKTLFTNAAVVSESMAATLEASGAGAAREARE